MKQKIRIGTRFDLMVDGRRVEHYIKLIRPDSFLACVYPCRETNWKWFVDMENKEFYKLCEHGEIINVRRPRLFAFRVPVNVFIWIVLRVVFVPILFFGLFLHWLFKGLAEIGELIEGVTGDTMKKIGNLRIK